MNARTVTHHHGGASYAQAMSSWAVVDGPPGQGKTAKSPATDAVIHSELTY